MITLYRFLFLSMEVSVHYDAVKKKHIFCKTKNEIDTKLTQFCGKGERAVCCSVKKGERSKQFSIDEYFGFDGQLVFIMERYRYASCALMIKHGNHLTASTCTSLLDEQHKNTSHHSYSNNALSGLLHSKL